MHIQKGGQLFCCTELLPLQTPCLAELTSVADFVADFGAKEQGLAHLVRGDGVRGCPVP